MASVGNLRLHLDKLDLELRVQTFALSEQAAVELHFDFLDLRWDQMGGNICEMLLDLLHLSEAQASLVWLIVHFEVLDLLKLVLTRPFHRLCTLFLLSLRLLISSFISSLIYLILDACRVLHFLAKIIRSQICARAGICW